MCHKVISLLSEWQSNVVVTLPNQLMPIEINKSLLFISGWRYERKDVPAMFQETVVQNQSALMMIGFKMPIFVWFGLVRPGQVQS
jgi:hypothetical protein